MNSMRQSKKSALYNVTRQHCTCRCNFPRTSSQTNTVMGGPNPGGGLGQRLYSESMTIGPVPVVPCSDAGEARAIIVAMYKYGNLTFAQI